MHDLLLLFLHLREFLIHLQCYQLSGLTKRFSNYTCLYFQPLTACYRKGELRINGMLNIGVPKIPTLFQESCYSLGAAFSFNSKNKISKLNLCLHLFVSHNTAVLSKKIFFQNMFLWRIRTFMNLAWLMQKWVRIYVSILTIPIHSCISSFILYILLNLRPIMRFAA